MTSQPDSVASPQRLNTNRGVATRAGHESLCRRFRFLDEDLQELTTRVGLMEDEIALIAEESSQRTDVDPLRFASMREDYDELKEDLSEMVTSLDRKVTEHITEYEIVKSEAYEMKLEMKEVRELMQLLLDRPKFGEDDTEERGTAPKRRASQVD
eukprot:g657.t1